MRIASRATRNIECLPQRVNSCSFERIFNMVYILLQKNTWVRSGLKCTSRIFGIPFFFVGNEGFFGKDRLGQVEEMLMEG